MRYICTYLRSGNEKYIENVECPSVSDDGTATTVVCDKLYFDSETACVSIQEDFHAIYFLAENILKSLKKINGGKKRARLR